MFSSGFRGQKLRVNLKLAINRLKMLEKKKSKLLEVYVCSALKALHIIEALSIVFCFGTVVLGLLTTVALNALIQFSF